MLEPYLKTTFAPTIMKMASEQSLQQIFQTLSTKSKLKQSIYQNIQKNFSLLREMLRDIEEALHHRLENIAPEVEVLYTQINEFESHLKFGGDILVFSMHTNVFGFPQDHVIHKNEYVAQDPDRAFCGMINIYNFLADSLKYERLNDLGYLIGRIFINHEDHFFVDGNKRLMFHFSNFASLVMNEQHMNHIVENAIQFALDFDLFVPPFEAVREISLGEKLMQQNMHGIRTAKRLGFDLTVFEAKDNEESQ